jgi:hypothetical protein
MLNIIRDRLLLLVSIYLENSIDSRYIL